GVGGDDVDGAVVHGHAGRATTVRQRAVVVVLDGGVLVLGGDGVDAAVTVLVHRGDDPVVARVGAQAVDPAGQVPVRHLLAVHGVLDDGAGRLAGRRGLTLGADAVLVADEYMAIKPGDFVRAAHIRAGVCEDGRGEAGRHGHTAGGRRSRRGGHGAGYGGE